MNIKNSFVYSLFFLLLGAVALFISNYQLRSHEKEILNQEKELLLITYNTIIKAYKTHSEIYFSTKVNVPRVFEIMKRANSADIEVKNNARGELYGELIESYNSMRLFKIKQLHFHLPNSESFLRFHRPQRYGDSLVGIRDTVVYTNKHKEPVSGFEEGKIYNGYRFIYPIIDKEQNHYGSVEISVSMQEIVQQLREETISSADFIIKKKIVQEKVFEDELKNYAQSKISDGYLYEKSISGSSGNSFVESVVKEYPQLQESISQEAAFSFCSFVEDRVFVTTFIPIYNKYSKQHVAYIVVSRPNPSLEHIYKRNGFITAILIIFIVLLAYAFFRVKKTTMDLKKKNSSLNEIQHIAKLGSWELDAKTNKIEWSDEVYTIFKTEPQSFEPTYEKFLSFVHPQDREKVAKEFDDSIKTKRDYEVQHRVESSDGTIIYVNEAGHHIYDKNGEHLQTVGTVHDITKIVEYEEKITTMQSELESIIRHIPDILFRFKIDDEMTMLFVNEAIYRVSGYKAESFINNKVRSYRSIIDPKDREAVQKKILDALKTEEEYTCEYRIINSIGDAVWVKESGKKRKNSEGLEIVEGLISDITTQKNDMAKLHKFIDLQDSIVLLSDAKKIIFANKKFFDFFGYENLEDFQKEYACICDRFVEDDAFFHLGKMLPKEEHWIRSMLNLSGRQRVVSMRNKNGKLHAFSVSFNMYDPQSYVINFSDISDTMLEKLQLETKAVRDHLTNAYNRTYFDESIASIMTENEKKNAKTGVMIFDIDYFKSVNDNYGHAIGDEVLKTIVEIVNGSIRKEDKLIRWGGEEFIVIAGVNNVQELQKLCEHLRIVIQDYRFEQIQELTCSFGAALHEEQNPIEETIKKADAKLYEAKNSGRNRVVV